jgi:transposase
MLDLARIWNPWFSLSLQGARLAWEAQSVVALRLMRIASESAQGRRSEAHRMVTEKMAALTEAQTAAAIAAVRGGSGHRVAKKVLGVYKKRVRRNKKRLSGKL